ncbi:MAG: hypothetical protein ACLQJ7_16070 [Syntrophobacteraceae bacterium]
MLLNLIGVFKEFGGLINAALILSLGGLLVRILRATIRSKDAQIALLDKQLQAAQMFSAKNANEQFEALQQWYDRSVRELEEQKREAIQSHENDLRKRIEDEIQKRANILEQYGNRDRVAVELTSEIAIDEVAGVYKVVGHNPYSPRMSYLGDLSIERKGKTLIANWNIGPLQQKHQGVGLALGNAVAFEYAHKDNRKRTTGLVLYTFIGPQVMRGYWTGFNVDANALGFEECRKVQS